MSRYINFQRTLPHHTPHRRNRPPTPQTFPRTLQTCCARNRGPTQTEGFRRHVRTFILNRSFWVWQSSICNEVRLSHAHLTQRRRKPSNLELENRISLRPQPKSFSRVLYGFPFSCTQDILPLAVLVSPPLSLSLYILVYIIPQLCRWCQCVTPYVSSYLASRLSAFSRQFSVDLKEAVRSKRCFSFLLCHKLFPTSLY